MLAAHAHAHLRRSDRRVNLIGGDSDWRDCHKWSCMLEYLLDRQREAHPAGAAFSRLDDK